jgi:hypothetical protein
LLFDEEGPEIQRNIFASGGAARNNCSSSGKATETLFQNFSTNVFDDQINSALARKPPYFTWPGII